MSVWNQILQATHSALIDELNERFPTEKLELGLPKRIDGFSTLDGHTQVLLWETRSTLEGSGFTALSGNENQPADELASVFSNTRIRAEKEFKIRGIAANFGETLSVPEKIRMTIWLPIAVRRPAETRTFDLGIGVGA